MPIIELDVECPACGGTGLYVGMAERNGAAVVCSECRGIGCFHYKYEYKSFKKRKARGGVKRVFLRAGGYVHSAEDVTTEEGALIEFSAAGVSYEDWLAGEHPKPVKELYCPLLWTGQRAKLAHCDNMVGCYIPKCQMYEKKAECWEAFEREFPNWRDPDLCKEDA